ncbi:hypothetical protein PAXRUDRAFT_157662, partial [Paxillus rubicundulus Ve08.2h10]
VTNLAGGEEIMVKFEHAGVTSTLKHKFTVPHQLAGMDSISQTFWFGEEVGSNAIVPNQLGPSLEQVFSNYNHIFSPPTITEIVEQLVCQIDKLTLNNADLNISLIVSEISPSNILIGHDQCAHLIYLIDFSHAAEYHHPKTHLHHCFHEQLPFIGTPVFVSINSHIGHKLARQDNIKSLTYIMIHFWHGSLLND